MPQNLHEIMLLFQRLLNVCAKLLGFHKTHYPVVFTLETIHVKKHDGRWPDDTEMFVKCGVDVIVCGDICLE